jgi:hypothetical protein
MNRISALGLATMLAGCSTSYRVENPMAPYETRSIYENPATGNDQAANAAIQTIDPWHRYAFDPNIPGNGPRSAAAIKTYQTGGGANGAASTLVNGGGAPDAGSGAH